MLCACTETGKRYWSGQPWAKATLEEADANCRYELTNLVLARGGMFFWQKEEMYQMCMNKFGYYLYEER